jgi:hypothetical protein
MNRSDFCKTCSFVFILSTLLLVSCSPSDKDTKDSNPILPTSLGKSGEMLVVMDTLLWQSELGDSLRKIILSPYPGILQEEPYFKVRNVNPLRMIPTLEKFRNVVYVITFDNQTAAGKVMNRYLSKETKLKSAGNNDLFMLLRRNADAENQMILLLFAPTIAQLKENLSKHQGYLRNILEQEAVVQARYDLSKTLDTKLAEQVAEITGLKMDIPKGFQIVKNQDNFLWIREIKDPYDHSLVISHEPYISTGQFTLTDMLATRDLIMKPNLTGSGLKDTVSYMLTETLIQPDYKVISNSPYTTEMRGLWRLKNNSRGGSFIARQILDTISQKVYYVESFLYAPGQGKRDKLREYTALLNSIKFQTVQSN